MSDGGAVLTVPKAVAEYPLPAAAQTHEVAYPGSNLLVVTQQTDSVLVQMALDPATGRPLEAAGHLVGTPRSGLHGLFASHVSPGCVWTTLQFDDKLLLVQPGPSVDVPPTVLREISIPAPARGPHVVVEYGDDLWTTCKDSSHVVRVSASNPSTVSVYPCSRRPIFVARHPTSGRVYASLDKSSSILGIDPGTGSTWEVAVPADRGTTPVGLVAGPDGNVWFVLLGGSAGGTGTFAKITDDGTLVWYRLTTGTASSAGLIHLAWSTSADGEPLLWLLASSISNMMLPNAVVRVTFQDDYGAIATQETYSLPTQMCMSHRVLPVGGSLYVSEMMSSVIAHIPVARASTPSVDEASDYYADYGLGQPASHIVYADPYGPA
jgi:virginiamycin B lyase